MASAITYTRNLALRLLSDTADLTRGLDDAERSVTDLGDTTTRTLGDGGTFDRNLADATDTARTRGAEAGQQLSQGIADGVETGDWTGAVSNTFTGLADLLPIGAAGAAIGGGLILSMVKAVQASRQKFYDSVNELFSQVETRANTSNRKIRQSILDSFTFQSVLDQLGGDKGVLGGVEKVQQWVELTGASFNDIVDILRGDINPSNRDTLILLQQQATQTAQIAAGGKAIGEAKTREAAAATEILGLYGATLDKQTAAEDVARKNVGYLQHQRDLMKGIADDAERTAAAAERTAAAVSKWAGRRLPDPTGTTS